MFRDTSRVGNQHVVERQRSSSATPTCSRRRTPGRRTSATSSHGSPPTGDRDARIGGRGASRSGSPSRRRWTRRSSATTSATSSSEWQDGRRDGQRRERRRRDAIAAILADELERRWQLTEQAYRPASPTTSARSTPASASWSTQAHAEFWFQHQRIELRLNDPSQGPAFVAHPETDFHGSAAASRYLIHAAADEAYIGYLIHDDPALFREALDDGRAFEARVVAGVRRRHRPVDRPALGAPPRPVAPAPAARERPRRARTAPGATRRRSSRSTPTEDDLLVTIEWTGRKTKPLLGPIVAKPADDAWVGDDVAFVQSDAASLTQRRSQRVWAAANGPGAWLTHGKASAPIEISSDDGATDLVVDDVAQIEDGATV